MALIKHNGKLLLLVLAAIFLGWLALTLAVPQAAAEPAAVAATDLTWNVVANGGTTMKSASYTLVSTAGQPAAGEMTGSSHNMVSGYWAGLRAYMETLFLPTVRAN